MKKFIFMMSLLFFWSVGCKPPPPEDILILENAPDAGPLACVHEGYEHYNFSLSSWKDSSEIRYYIVNLPFDYEQAEVDIIVGRAWNVWNQEIPVPITQTTDSLNADIFIFFNYMDGKQGTLGQSEFPPSSEHTLVPIHVTFDKYDVHGSQGGSAVFDFFTVAVHEFGHSLGLRHSQNRRSIMYPTYTKAIEGLNLDDVLGIRTIYTEGIAFEHDDCQFIWISQDSEQALTSNFKESEFFTYCEDIHVTGHYLNEKVIDGLQAVRDAYGVPIQVISTFRDDFCNVAAGGSSLSQHTLHNAVDWKFIGKDARWVHKQYMKDIKDQQCTLGILLTLGVRGYGSYDHTNHIDTRVSSTGSKKFGNTSYATWGLLNPQALTVENTEGRESFWLNGYPSGFIEQ